MTASSEQGSQLWSLPPHHVKALSEQGSVKAYPKNTIIVSEGERSDSLFIILSGRVKVFLADEEGKEVLLSTQGPGEYFGEMILDEGPRSASVMTLEPSRFAVITTAQFKQFLADNPEAGVELVKSLIHRVRELTRAVGNLALLDVYGRVARLLLDLAAEQDGRQVITAHLTQQDMASRVGCSREMISRIMKDLRTGGYIQADGDNIVIAKTPPRNW
ncbi:MAG TPA: cyclic nucleotide-binding domain-containing protein [Burkholderiales bacterium]